MNKTDLLQAKIFHFNNSEEMADLKRKLAYWSFRDMKVVFTNGCFDLMHLGHIDYLSKAAEFGKVFIIGLNSDISVKKIKGTNRPVNDENSRAIILAAMGFVNAVVVFDEETPYQLIKTVQPDVLVKGSDYLPEQIAGFDIVKAKGGEVITLNFIEGYSSTAIIEKIKKMF